MKRTPITLAAVLLAALPAVLFAQDDPAAKYRYQTYLLQCQMLKKSQVVQDNTALEKVDYAMYQRQQMLKREFPDTPDPTRDADGCLTYAEWLKQNPSTPTKTGAKTKPKTKPTATAHTTPKTQTPQTTPNTDETMTPLQRSQTTGSVTTTPTQNTPTTGNATTTPTEEQPVKSAYGPETYDEWLSKNKSTQDLLLLNKEGGSPKNSPTMDGSENQDGTVKVEGSGKDKKKRFSFTKKDKQKQTDVPNLAAGPDMGKPEHKRSLWDKITGRNKAPIEQGALEGQPVADKGKNLGNIVGGGKFAVYSGLLAAMFLTGPGALAGIVLFATIGFFAGLWVTKKNG